VDIGENRITRKSRYALSGHRCEGTQRLLRQLHSVYPTYLPQALETRKRNLGSHLSPLREQFLDISEGHLGALSSADVDWGS
jgi:hypothetical protein